MKLTILQSGDPILRAKATAVPTSMYGTDELRKMITDMAETLEAQDDGVAIAAPQVGISSRIFLVRYDRMRPPPGEGEPPRPADVGVFINPEFVKLSRKYKTMDEGCLSVRNVYGQTKRKDRATVRAYDAEGNAFERGGGGILAQAFQHEIDHLDGVLFTDDATKLVEIKEEDRAKEREERRERRQQSGAYDES